MNARRIPLAISMVAVAAVGLWQVIAGSSAFADEKKEEKKHPVTTLSVPELIKKKGPTPPAGSTPLGVEAQPTVGELQLPLKNVQVFSFQGKTKTGVTVPVNWAYSPGSGTYMWGTAPVQCENGTSIARGGFVMQIHDDGTGAYALGSNQCPVGVVYGCKFDSHAKEKECGACAWNANELACTEK
jgi:hypothetical protein